MDVCSALCWPLPSAKLISIGVQFTEKPVSLGDALQPNRFLTHRSIERRQKEGVEYSDSDLPIPQQYIVALAELAQLHGVSKWLNGAVIRCKNDVLPSIESLTFVDSIKYIGKYRNRRMIMRQRIGPVTLLTSQLQTVLQLHNLLHYLHK